MMGGSEADPGKDANKLTNRTTLVQQKVLAHLLMLGVESQWAPVAVRCSTLQCIGNLIAGHPKNLDALASKFLGEGPQEPALNSILRIILWTSACYYKVLTSVRKMVILRYAAELLVFFLM